MDVVWYVGVSSWLAHLFKVWKDEHEMLSVPAASVIGWRHAPGRSPPPCAHLACQRRGGFLSLNVFSLKVMFFIQ